MLKKLLSLLVFTTSMVNAQYIVKGTMTPPGKGDWAILYKLEGAKQKFITNTTVKVDTVNINGETEILGKFLFTLPEDAKTGAYRVSYRNKGAGFVDFLFNKENVEFIFNPLYPDQSVVFTSSRENKLYSQYLEAIGLSQKKVDEIQANYIKSPTKDAKKAYKKAYKDLEDVQDIYENKSEGMLVSHFIKASKRYNTSNPTEDIQDYLNSIGKNFFNNIDFKSNELYNSSFLIDRVTDYIFGFNFSDDQVLQQKLYKEAIITVMDKVSKDNLRKEVTEYLITTFTDKRNSEIVDWVFAEYYKKLPKELQDSKFKQSKLDLLRATVGRVAPDFSWKEYGTRYGRTYEKDYKLSTLNDGENYLLIFWSTGCSHCLKEIPVLYKFMKNHKKTSVVAFGIENDDLDWNEYIKKLHGWHNAMGTHPENKWDNRIVRTYQLIATPAYFVLDANKKIIAMPNTIEDVEKYFNKLNAKKKANKKQKK
ncbi:TlpA family protein disulfide reductase [Tenacibaculum maritimum]|uniref:TlpA family protein disulfide reductase n=1 Tax=Tenacibaculum maritimum TaxID=107401 RepID=UPI0012E661F0|nr:TlpA disulfide reductase family protein [Tenacibaculum maritimum]CAA0173874.1 Thiol-disulfide oxidoreductase precursor [Tenacibaculum maritimum]